MLVGQDCRGKNLPPIRLTNRPLLQCRRSFSTQFLLSHSMIFSFLCKSNCCPAVLKYLPAAVKPTSVANPTSPTTLKYPPATAKLAPVARPASARRFYIICLTPQNQPRLEYQLLPNDSSRLRCPYPDRFPAELTLPAPLPSERDE